MNKTKITIAAVAVIAAVTAAYTVQILGSENALFERFPDLDPKLVAKAHRKMLSAALSGQYSDLDLDNDAVCDKIFLETYENLKK